MVGGAALRGCQMICVGMARAATGLVAFVASGLVACVAVQYFCLFVQPPCPLICWVLTASSAAFALCPHSVLCLQRVCASG